MADETPPRQMSLVPYQGEILLQQGRAVVVYDAQSRQLSVRNAQDTSLLIDCPYCHRPLHEDLRPDTHHGQPDHYNEPFATGSQSFVDPDYFGMLAQSQRTTPAGSGFGTPTHSYRLYHPALRSGRSRDVSGSQPPADAEFVASEPSPAKGQGISSSAFSPGYFKQFFREERELGRGGNGVVLLVEHLLDGVSLGHFACKRIPVGNDHQWLEKVLVEVKLLAAVPHKNLVKYHWVWVEEHQPASFGPSVPCVWILQEYCNGGDLHNYVLGPRDDVNTAEKLKARHRKYSRGNASPPDNLRKHSKLTLDEILSFFRDITSGLHHLHSKGYLHRDVKPSNCLLQESDGRVRVLLSDFGEVQAVGTRRGNTGATGTISYCAPEVLRQDAVHGGYGNFTTKSDIFSLGMIVHFMCFGRLPYENADDENEDNEDLELLRAEIAAWDGFDDLLRSRQDLPDRLYRYLQRLLSVDPNERPSTDEILASIRAGTGFTDARFASIDDDDARVFPVDKAENSMQSRDRRASYIGRAGLSQLGRSYSGDTIKRSPSPIKRDSDAAIAGTGSKIVLRSRTIDKGIAPSSSPPPLSPRLMLPPPPAPITITTRLQRLTTQPEAVLLLKSAVFGAKLLTLLLPCSPYMPRAWTLYPLLIVAVWEFAVESLSWRRTSTLFVFHLIVIFSLARYSQLCHSREGFEPIQGHEQETWYAM